VKDVGNAFLFVALKFLVKGADIDDHHLD
jgi:hypothetical protein